MNLFSKAKMVLCCAKYTYPKSFLDSSAIRERQSRIPGFAITFVLRRLLACTGTEGLQCFSSPCKMMLWLFTLLKNCTDYISSPLCISLARCKGGRDEARFANHLLASNSFMNQTTPCAIIASATFKKPAMFAPATRLSFKLNCSAAAAQFLYIFTIISCSFASTSSKVQLYRMEF